jgi:hypothetical protein
MRCQPLLILVAIAFVASCALVGMLAVAAPVQASDVTLQGTDGCALEHTVKPGETLIRIAQKYDTTVAELLRLNSGRIRNRNIIAIGLKLCVTGLARYTQAILQVDLQYEQVAEEAGLDLMVSRAGLTGKRTVFPLAANGVQYFASHDALMAALDAAALPPVLYGIREQDETGITHTLVLRREPNQIELFPSREGCEIAVSKALTGFQQVTVTLVMETAAGFRHPFTVTHVSQRAGFGAADLCGSNFIDLALLPAGANDPHVYNLFLLRPDVEEEEDRQAEAHNAVAIEVSYWPTPVVGSQLGPLNEAGVIGKRVVYALHPLEGLTALTDTNDVRAAVAFGEKAPLFYGVRNLTDGAYGLLAVGGFSQIASLFVTTPQTITVPGACRLVRLVDAFTTPKFNRVQMTLFLENEAGVRIPLPITTIGYIRDASSADTCRYTKAAFALFPATDQYHEFKIVLNDGEFGPPGGRRGASCRRWRRTSGLIYRVLRSWWGC